jgi:hypothetical protein
LGLFDLVKGHAEQLGGLHQTFKQVEMKKAAGRLFSQMQ